MAKGRTSPDISSTPRSENGDWTLSISAGQSVKYTSIVDSMAEAIASGQLAEGERLPPHRELATRFGVTVATVTKAIADLSRRGLVDTRRGSGTFVAGIAAGATAHAHAQPEAPVDLAVNRPPVAVAAPFLKEALQVVANRIDPVDLFGYEVVGGSAANRAAGAAWLAERGIASGDADVLVTNGGNDGLLAALFACCRPGEAVACEALNYTGIRRLAQAVGITLVPVEMDERGLRLDSLERACRTQDIRALLCTPVTHNPTAASMDSVRRAEICKIARARNLFVIEDDIYGHLAGVDDETLFAVLPERTLHVSGLSKCASAGLRVGYLAVPRSLSGRVRDALYVTNWTAPSLHAAVAAWLIGSGLARELVAAQRTEALARMALARKILGRTMAHQDDRPSYHAWVAVERDLRVEELAAELQRAGILVSPAHHFAIPGAAVPSAIRLSLGAARDRPALDLALREVARHLVGAPMSIGAIA